MFKRVAQCLSALIVSIFSLSATAATVNLAPESLVVQEGSTFNVDVYMDAAEVTIANPGSINGEIIIDFNPAQATYTGFTPVSPAELLSGPTPTSGNPFTVELGFEKAAKVGIIGRFSFIATGVAGTAIDIGLQDASTLNFFWSSLPTNQPFRPTLTGTSIQIAPIPVPAAAWLMLSALGLLGVRARRLKL